MKLKRQLAAILSSAALLITLAGMTTASAFPEEGTIIIDGKTFTVNRDCKGDNWHYEAKERTLFLEGYEGLYIDLGPQEEGVAVNLSGSNKITSNVAIPALMADGDLTISGEGTLELDVSACHCAVYAKNSVLTIRDTSVTVKGSGEVSDAAYILMADSGLSISNSKIEIADEVKGQGGAIGTLTGDLTVNNSTLVVSSTAKALASLEGQVLVSGGSALLSSAENAIYAKGGCTIEGAAKVEVVCTGEDTTAVYCPEGDIHVTSSELTVDAEKTALAGKYVILNDAYIAGPEEGTIREISSMCTIYVDGNVAPDVQILSGEKPTPTPTPSPTPVPTPTNTPVPESESGSGFSVTPKMIVGAGLLLVGIVVIVVILVSRNRE